MLINSTVGLVYQLSYGLFVWFLLDIFGIIFVGPYNDNNSLQPIPKYWIVRFVVYFVIRLD